MTTKVFIAGSLSIDVLDPVVEARISRIVSRSLEVIVGDADGVDGAVQALLQRSGHAGTTVYCSGDEPRNNLGNWPVCRVQSPARRGTRAFFTAKDRRMAEDADIGLMIWDSRSTGTLSNVLELVRRQKKSVVFVQAAHGFRNIASVQDFEQLVELMAAPARRQAERKMDLSAGLQALKQAALVL